MVRHKTRWLLVRLDFSETVLDGEDLTSGAEKAAMISTNDIFHSIRLLLERAFGVASASFSNEVQVRYYDQMDRLVLIRVPRDACGKVRAVLTFMTQIIFSNTARRQSGYSASVGVVACVVATSGSARTAKLATLHHMKRNLRVMHEKQVDSRNSRNTRRKIRDLHERMEEIRKVE